MSLDPINNSEDYAVIVSNITKKYKHYERPRHRIQEMLRPILGKIKPEFDRQYFRDIKALNDVSFSLKKGDSLGIIGRNGSGKSTLLQIIAGTLTPSSGDVLVNGRVNALLELGSGFNLEFTGKENIYLNGAILGFSNSFIKSKYDEIVEFSEIGNYINQPVKTYSSGMFVRLAFSVQALMDPDILIVDEALSVGDVFFQAKCFDLIERMLKNGKTTFLFVSHDIHTVIKYCKHALLLNKGNQVYLGDARVAAGLYYKVEKYNEYELQLEGKRIDSENSNTNKKQNLKLKEDFISPNAIRFSSGSFDRLELIGYSIKNIEHDQEVLYVGDYVRFSFHFLVNDNIETILFALGFTNTANNSIYGKFNFQIDTNKVPRNLKKGEEVTITYDLKLSLLPDDYIIGLTINEMEIENFDIIESLSIQRYASSLINIFTAQITSFKLIVSPKDLFLPFMGLVDLPVELTTEVNGHQ
ncbi:ABC transporter ATP-binding protein [Leptospira congkakensis]|uniref:ABC transporter ATP-binding protein n=1 Tax=Leptospira congkakensis TaxID=2484932 RepID=A0A4Z1AC94_9LEPT|nr:ABC transporter ATP-binding protein [Leptospira congkakensis]TGL90232.1 ABC transporter ATP-binding protein [Leptospira congkakensis]TGL91238.1 ABC transporter ATP-binding protein [Leptospira congkakensis]TGL98290.1 ABC transporter ATP-binding protein [Leptospira congkakensis]